MIISKNNRFSILTAALGVKIVHDKELFSIQKLYAASADNNTESSNEIDLSDALAETLTDLTTIKSNSDRMKYRMEAFITNLQGKIIKQLQEVDGGSTFKVDRWLRKEVS